jgi:hypothetical protein
MADIAFDPTLQCPVIRNFECVQEECSFWNADKAECLYFDGLVGKEGYNEVSQLIVGITTNTEIDLGLRYRDITIFVDQACSVRFQDTAHPSISLSVATGRINTAVVFKGINARKVYVTTTVNTNVTVFGNR